MADFSALAPFAAAMVEGDEVAVMAAQDILMDMGNDRDAERIRRLIETLPRWTPQDIGRFIQWMIAGKPKLKRKRPRKEP